MKLHMFLNVLFTVLKYHVHMWFVPVGKAAASVVKFRAVNLSVLVVVIELAIVNGMLKVSDPGVPDNTAILFVVALNL